MTQKPVDEKSSKSSKQPIANITTAANAGDVSEDEILTKKKSDRP